MRYVLDLLSIIIARWKNCTKLVLLTVCNMTVGLCILTIFLNIGFNINNYIKDNFLSNERLQHILVCSNEKCGIAKNSDFFNDINIESARIIYNSNINVNTVGGIDYSEAIYLDITIIDSDNLLFEGEYMSDQALKEVNGDWKKGIILSEQCLAIFGDSNPMGQNVNFTYQGLTYNIPIVGIILSKAEENYDLSYRSFMYISSEYLENIPDFIEVVDLRVAKLDDVGSFIKAYEDEPYQVFSNIHEVERILSLTKIISYILIFSGIFFIFFSSLGIVNSLKSMHDVNMKNICLTQIIGFSKKTIWIMNNIENCILSIICAFITGFITIITLHLMQRSELFNFQFINASVLFRLNFEIIGICMLLSFLIIFVCKIFVLSKVKNTEIIELLKSE